MWRGSLPLERILIETDAPFLAPQPYRGKRNEPAYVAEVARTIASVRNLQPGRSGQCDGCQLPAFFSLAAPTESTETSAAAN